MTRAEQVAAWEDALLDGEACLECVYCKVVGFEEPWGSTVAIRGERTCVAKDVRDCRVVQRMEDADGHTI